MRLRSLALTSIILTSPGCTARAEEVACEKTPWRVAGGNPLPPQEELNFALRWGIITAGAATLKVEGIEKIRGRSAIHVSSFARSTGVVNTFYTVRDHSDAWLDAE